MQLRRLDPLANAGPYQRLAKSPVKTFSLRLVQFERIQEQRPDLVLIEGEAGVVGNLYRDFLEVHYGFPSVAAFDESFDAMFERVVGASSKQEAPRGLVVPFQDRTNRRAADTTFWRLGLEAGEEWVELSRTTIPEVEAPADEVGEGYRLRELGSGEIGRIGVLDGEATGRGPLSAAGVESVRRDAKLFRVVVDPADQAVGYLSLHTEPAGWGAIEALILGKDAPPALRAALIEWSVAWLRNNGARRVRRRVNLNDAEIGMLRDRGFVAGETGVYFYRSVDPAEVKASLDERKAHGTIIKFGGWR
jgi:hypothetical protein